MTAKDAKPEAPTLEEIQRQLHARWRWVDGLGDLADLTTLIRLAYEAGRRDAERQRELDDFSKCLP
jgi:hypothetical protein